MHLFFSQREAKRRLEDEEDKLTKFIKRQYEDRELTAMLQAYTSVGSVILIVLVSPMFADCLYLAAQNDASELIEAGVRGVRLHDEISAADECIVLGAEPGAGLPFKRLTLPSFSCAVAGGRFYRWQRALCRLPTQAASCSP